MPLLFLSACSLIYVFIYTLTIYRCVWLETGFGLVNRFICHLYTRLEIASNYSAIADIYILQITRAHAKISQSAFTSRFPVTS
jgi:hypothetical protein